MDKELLHTLAHNHFIHREYKMGRKKKPGLIGPPVKKTGPYKLRRPYLYRHSPHKMKDPEIVEFGGKKYDIAMKKGGFTNPDKK